MFYSDQSTLEVFNYFLFTPGYADCTKNVKPKLKKKLSQVFVVFIIGVKWIYCCFSIAGKMTWTLPPQQTEPNRTEPWLQNREPNRTTGVSLHPY